MNHLISIILSLLLLITTVLGGEFKTFTFGGRANKIYIPNVTSSPIPLYVMLHGCTQNPTDFATGTKMNTFADQYNFLVLYPEQTSSANSNKCWNWFEPAHQKRGSGEPNLIATMIDEVKKQYKVDNARVYVGGLSAGAAFSVIMGVTYPDYFAAVAVGAGLEWKAATSLISAITAMSSGGPNPVSQGDDAYNTMSSRAKTLGILVIHGTSDTTVAPINAEQIIKQFARTNDKVIGNGTANGVITDIPTSSQDGTVPGGRAFTIKNYDDPTTGKTLMKWVQVKSMAHAWSGGSSSGTYTDPKGPDASQIMIDFFSTFPSGGVTTTTTTTTTTTGPVTTGSVTTGMPLDKSLILYAVASESGFVGMTVLDGYSVDEAKIGSKAGYINDAYRTILTFDTGAIPVKINTTRALLRIYRKSLTGNVNQISVDFKDGSFGTTGALKQSDYYASATVAKVVTLYPPSQDGQFSEVELPQTVAKSIVNKGPNSRVSFRLRDPSTTVSANANTLWIYGGEAEVPRYAASLTIFFA